MYSEIKFILYLCLIYNKNLLPKVCANPVNDEITVKRSLKPIIIQEVPIGKTVTLKCRSNDNNHSFLYWHLGDKNTIVGPGNSFNTYKYKYEVLSGNLTIETVSENEAGIYNCVSRGVRSDDFNIRSVRMIVTKDWEDVYEHDPGVNFVRISIVIVTIAILSGIGYIVYRIWKQRFRHPSYLVPSDDEDDSGEEIFRAPGTSRSGGNIVLSKSTDSFDNPGISTDFKSILDTANNK